jgi:transcriptional repressor NrdR
VTPDRATRSDQPNGNGPGTVRFAMQCPLCQAADTRVIDSRPVDSNSAIRRRRLCVACDHRFTTYERSNPVTMVRKRSGRLEAFQPDKLRTGLSSALAGRPVVEGSIDLLVERIESEVVTLGPVVSSDVIGRLVLDQLRQLDEVAYLRFASVYKSFNAGSDFERELAALENQTESLDPTP